MRHFIRTLKDLKLTLDYLFMFSVFLNSIIVFLLFYLILSLFNFHAFYIALGISLLYFLRNSFRKLGEDKLEDVERVYDVLDEKLHTAADNVSKKNIIVESLQSEVVRDIDKVEASSFFNVKSTVTKLGLFLVLTFLIIFLAPVDLSDDVKEFMPDLSKIWNLGFGGDVDKEELGELVRVKKTKDKDEAALEIKRRDIISLKLKPLSTELKEEDVEDIRKWRFKSTFPVEIFPSNAEAFEENVPREQQELVRKYYDNLREG